MKHNNTHTHSPKITGMIDDVPRALSRTGLAVVLILLAAIVAAMLLIPSPYDARQNFGTYILSALL